MGHLLQVLGPSDPRLAKKQSQFFLRGSFGEDTIQNAFYGTLGKLVNFCFFIALVDCAEGKSSKSPWITLDELLRRLTNLCLPYLLLFVTLCVLGSETYEEAIRDVKLLFPEGVCCPPSIDLKAEEVCTVYTIHC